MNKYVNSETRQHTMKLVQMGAEVDVVSSNMVYVSFKLSDDIEVSYVYNVNKKGHYFIERIKPYPITIKEFETQDDVINIIKIDVDQFKNALKSHNIHSFIKINQKLHEMILDFEDLFLYYNVPEKDVEKLFVDIDYIHEHIAHAHRNRERVYFGKEPEHLKDTAKKTSK